jgi:hypothetical protein
LLAGGLLAAWQPARPVFRPAEEVNAFKYLQNHAQNGAVILTAYETGNALPAWAPVRVVIGHGPESANLDVLQPQVEGFFSAQMTDEERLALLKSAEVHYVFWGPAEQRLGDWDPYQAAYLKPSYRSGLYHVFETRINPGSYPKISRRPRGAMLWSIARETPTRVYATMYAR